MNRSLRLHFIARYRRWQYQRAVAKHARNMAAALRLVAQTNPTLASVTTRRIAERLADTPVTTSGLVETIADITALTDDALASERRRRGWLG